MGGCKEKNKPENVLIAPAVANFARELHLTLWSFDEAQYISVQVLRLVDPIITEEEL